MKLSEKVWERCVGEGFCSAGMENGPLLTERSPLLFPRRPVPIPERTSQNKKTNLYLPPLPLSLSRFLPLAFVHPQGNGNSPPSALVPTSFFHDLQLLPTSDPPTWVTTYGAAFSTTAGADGTYLMSARVANGGE